MKGDLSILARPEKTAPEVSDDEDEHDRNDERDDQDVDILDEVRCPIFWGRNIARNHVNRPLGEAAAGTRVALTAGSGKVGRMDGGLRVRGRPDLVITMARGTIGHSGFAKF